MTDQAARLRELVREVPAAARGRIVAVTSGKGGAGKTNVAVNLSIALADQGHRVVLMDLDLGLANADILLGVDARHTLADVISGRRRLDEVLMQVAPRLRLLPGASGFARAANLSSEDREALLAGLEALEASADLLVVDTGAGISQNVIPFVCAADEAVVVTTPEPTSVTDAFMMIKTIVRYGSPERLRLLVNQARDRGEAFRVAERIAAVSRQILKAPVEKMGYVVSDYRLQAAVQRRRPVLWDTPQAASSACFRTLAGILAGRGARRATTPPRGFFRRLLSWAPAGRSA